jgi:hypothetical protein
MRKKESLVVDVGGKPVELTFQRPTLDQENEYRDWLRKQTVDDTRDMLRSASSVVQIQTLAELCKSLSAGACSLTGQHGLTSAIQGEGMRRFMKVAAAETHPDITDATLHEIISENYEACIQVVKNLLPVKLDDPDPKAPAATGARR